MHPNALLSWLHEQTNCLCVCMPLSKLVLGNNSIYCKTFIIITIQYFVLAYIVQYMGTIYCCLALLKPTVSCQDMFVHAWSFLHYNPFSFLSLSARIFCFYHCGFWKLNLMQYYCARWISVVIVLHRPKLCLHKALL